MTKVFNDQEIVSRNPFWDPRSADCFSENASDGGTRRPLAVDTSVALSRHLAAGR